MTLSLTQEQFVTELLDTGDAHKASALSGLPPSTVRDPRIQAALLEHITENRAYDAIFARKVLRDLATSADQDSTRLRAAMILWDRAQGRTPEQVEVNVHLHHASRDALYGEIRTLIRELGLPPAIEGEATETSNDA